MDDIENAALPGPPHETRKGAFRVGPLGALEITGLGCRQACWREHGGPCACDAMNTLMLWAFDQTRTD